MHSLVASTHAPLTCSPDEAATPNACSMRLMPTTGGTAAPGSTPLAAADCAMRVDMETRLGGPRVAVEAMVSGAAEAAVEAVVKLEALWGSAVVVCGPERLTVVDRSRAAEVQNGENED